MNFILQKNKFNPYWKLQGKLHIFNNNVSLKVFRLQIPNFT